MSTYAREMAEDTVSEALEKEDDIVDAIEATILTVIERCAVEAERPCSDRGVVERVIASRIRALAGAKP